jgi:hypothetical protein
MVSTATQDQSAVESQGETGPCVGTDCPYLTQGRESQRSEGGSGISKHAGGHGMRMKFSRLEILPVDRSQRCNRLNFGEGFFSFFFDLPFTSLNFL